MSRFSAASRRMAVLEGWLLLFFACSAAGWLWEVLLTVVTTGSWVNRGLLHGPWLPVYGVGGVLLAAALGRLRQRSAAALLLGALLGGAVEYSTTLVLERWYRRRWWDYTGWAGSIQGRVCLASLAAFALAGWMLPGLSGRLLQKISGLPAGVRTVLCRSVSLLFVLDWTLSLLHPNAGAGITCPL